MFILLPPSEGKRSPEANPVAKQVDLEDLSFPALGPARRRIVDQLIFDSTPPQAETVFTKLGPKAKLDLADNLNLFTAPAAAAVDVYDGVLYQAAGFQQLKKDLKPAQLNQVVVFSALWGPVFALDAITKYKLPMSTSLTTIGRLGTYWKKHLSGDLFAQDEVLIDCRSSDYQAAWMPGQHPNYASVKVFTDVCGKLKPISHNAKHTRGLITGILLRSTKTLRDLADVNQVLQDHVGTLFKSVELIKAKPTDKTTAAQHFVVVI